MVIRRSGWRLREVSRGSSSAVKRVPLFRITSRAAARTSVWPWLGCHRQAASFASASRRPGSAPAPARTAANAPEHGERGSVRPQRGCCGAGGEPASSTKTGTSGSGAPGKSSRGAAGPAVNPGDGRAGGRQPDAIASGFSPRPLRSSSSAVRPSSMPPAAVQRVARILRPGQRHAHRASVAVDARHALEALCPGHRAATLVGSAVVCNRLAGKARPTLSNHESRITATWAPAAPRHRRGSCCH
jgi:hypothetical protein